MKPERWRELQALFHRAVDLDERGRADFLESECAGDAELRLDLEALLRGDREGSDALSRLEAHTSVAPVDPLLGRVLGAYRIESRLAAGGMGVVYLAQRADGLYEQQVAVKLIRAEHATEWMLRRFEFERRTLAALAHPSIARVLDGGTTPEGCPYFVMEYVRGEALDRYCERERLGLAARLRLFVQVCRAVHYAHQNLVLHCDLKPANILIDERGEPRLLDFGIARLLEEGPSEQPAAAARTIAKVLTPEYASPEQLAGGALTTALDVYSLGVILYELATGRLPFESESRSPATWERLVHEQLPERPSTRVGRAERTHEPGPLAQRLRSTPAGLRRALRGDLDRIVLMALRKEPERRYSSAQEFADDLERHLAGEPVRARGNSLAYLAAKFVRRHRVAVGAGVLVLAALLFGLFTARRSERIAEEHAQHAEIEAESFQGVASFLMEAFLPAQPAQDPAWQQRARERVLEQAERVRRQHAQEDHMRANLLDTLGQVCRRLDLFDDARALIEEALAIREQAYGRQSLEYALSLRSLGQLEFQSGDFAAAAQHLADALPIHRAAGNQTHADVASIANDLAACLRNLGRDGEAEALHREALALRRARDPRSLPVAESLNNLAGVHLGRNELEPAVAELREALEIRASILGEGHLLALQTLSNLAAALWRHGDADEARGRMQKAETGFRALGVDGEDGLALTLANLGAMQLAAGERDGAATSLEAALELLRRRLGPDHPQVAASLAQLAALQHARRRDAEARAHWAEVLRIRRLAGTPPRALGEALYGQAVFLLDLGELGEAERGARDALALQLADEPRDSLALARTRFVLGACLARRGQAEEARTHWLESARLYAAQPGASEAEVTRVQRSLEGLDRPAAK
ncbi:MAG: serine/threonine protein kinase [Planctomycetes bacterium]|nr:serine/threonine protein kinase [Planctomycetota bacterium]